MILITSQNKFSLRNYVPSTRQTKKLPCFAFIIFLLLINSIIFNLQAHCSAVAKSDQDQDEFYARSNQDQANLKDLLIDYEDQLSPPIQFDYTSKLEADSQKPTPYLDDVFIARRNAFYSNNVNKDQIDGEFEHSNQWKLEILPQRVARRHAYLPQELSTPTVYSRQADQAQSIYRANSPNNLEDLIELGSGVEEGPPRQEEANLLANHIPTPSYVGPAGYLMTPSFGDAPAQTMRDIYDHAPLLARRVPKLVAVAGSFWHYTLPSDTFQDEDGDLTQLKSILSQGAENFGSTQPERRIQSQDKSLHWLKYDQGTHSLTGFPVDLDVGHHTYILQVKDRHGNSANETIDITVRPQQSSRAFTHAFTLEGIEMSHHDPYLIDTLNEVVKRITSDLFADKSSRSIVVHSYSFSKGSSTSRLTLTWSNSSMPINSCNLEPVINSLIDERNLAPNWSLASLSGSKLMPSQALIRALGPEFRPVTFSIELRGICANIERDTDQPRGSLSANLVVKTRIGKVKWQLGQPIIYRIPENVFVTDQDANGAQNLTLMLHTIEGLTLDQDPEYNFLEFDQETRTIFGLPFEVTRHCGQRELLLTAKHSPSNQVARETFIFDIEAQDLTTINNRAFRMSLYFMVRTSVFGPREQVQVSRRMINALEISDLNFNHDQTIQEFTVIHIQKFQTGAAIDNSASLSDPSNAWRYQDKIHLVAGDDLTLKNDKVVPFSSYGNNEGSYFYKLTWTNETIGHRGDCPVEVIKDNILYALERSMLDYVPPNDRPEDAARNDSARFYERLRSYFEPELDLIHLRFEPMSACVDAIEVHDVGNSEVADMADEASSSGLVVPPPVEIPPRDLRTTVEPKLKEISPINSDEYWAIVVLIILVVAIIFVVLMLFMGLHTYRINQEKRFELQMKLAQARQNSMYLSSLVLADQVRPFDIAGQQALLPPPGSVKSMFLDEGSSRKPVILDNEKQYFANGHIELQKPTAVQLMGHSIQTTALKPNMTFTLDSIANLQAMNANIGPDMMIGNKLALSNGQRSMTLNRRTTNGQAVMMGRKASMTNLSESQSILTVASIGPQMTMMPHSQANFYPPVPAFFESQESQPRL